MMLDQVPGKGFWFRLLQKDTCDNCGNPLLFCFCPDFHRELYIEGSAIEKLIRKGEIPSSEVCRFRMVLFLREMIQGVLDGRLTYHQKN